MARISNSTISLLLIATIALYVGGTFVTLNKLSSVGIAGPPMGFAITNTTANVSLSIIDATSIEWIVGNINWSSGSVSGSCDNCTMFTNASANGNGYNYSDNTGNFNSVCCVNFQIQNQSLLLRNTGNNNVSLQFNLSADTAAFFGAETDNNNLSWRVVPAYLRAHNQSDAIADTVDSCGGDYPWAINDTAALPQVNSSSGALESEWIPSEVVHGPTENFFICANATHPDKGFKFIGNGNEVNFDFRVVIAQAQGPGSFSLAATVLGTSS